MSPSANTSGWPGSVRSGSTVTRPARSRSAPVSSASLPARPEAVTPAAQMTVRLGIASTSPPACSIVTLSPSMPTTVRPVSTVTPSFSSERSAFADSDGGKVVSTRSAASTSRMRAVRGSIARKSRRRVSRASSPIWPAISTPVGPAPTTTNVSHAARTLGVGLRLGRLERAEEAAADDERALERLHLGGVRRASRRARSTSSCEPPATISVS